MVPKEDSMVIEKYIPERLYGFVTNGEVRLYFHLAAFDPGPYLGQTPVPPVIGESVEVHRADEGNKALSVSRINSPLEIEGLVDWFDEVKGYGFASTDEGNFYMHRSEVLGGRLPVSGRRVFFYVSEGNKRACHIRVESP